MSKAQSIIFALFFVVFGCNQSSSNSKTVTQNSNTFSSNSQSKNTEIKGPINRNNKTIHVLVALCDNKYQGIVPVPKSIGNGQNPKTNLYWGAAFGIKTFFKKSSQWELIKSYPVDTLILERLVFKHKTQSYYLVADAYNGKYIQTTTENFLKYLAGLNKDTIITPKDTIDIAGNSAMLCYIGHNGLMDFDLPNNYKNNDGVERDGVVLACYSKSYFQPYFQKINANPVLWTTHLMAPEAYTLHDALTGYVKNEPKNSIRERAAKAYAQYQKCSLKAAKNLLVNEN